MGGILRKLVENENAITVAYMTSGNLAVFDHDVRRHLDFLERVAGEQGIAERAGDADWWTGWRSSSPASARATWTSRRCATSSG